ncbi:MAG TPA: DUF4397 domain-containing protein [Chitinophagaceae bacterium]
MKRNILAILSFTAAVAFISCEKNSQRLISTTGTEGKALVKVNYAMAHMQTATLPAPVQLKINGERVSNLLTSTTHYTTPYPGGGLNTAGSSNPDYLAITPGTVNIGISKPNVGTNNDSIVLFTGSTTVEANKNYTIHLSDTGTNAALTLVEDNVSLPDSGKSRYVFVNLTPNSTAIDLYHGTVLVAQNIPYKGKSPEFLMQAGTAASWAIRPAGAAPTSTALATYSNTIPNQRSLTVFSRGYIGVTGARAPAISLIYNR